MWDLWNSISKHFFFKQKVSQSRSLIKTSLIEKWSQKEAGTKKLLKKTALIHVWEIHIWIFHWALYIFNFVCQLYTANTFPCSFSFYLFFTYNLKLNLSIIPINWQCIKSLIVLLIFTNMKSPVMEIYLFYLLVIIMFEFHYCFHSTRCSEEML